jgi:hypothetical protein
LGAAAVEVLEEEAALVEEAVETLVAAAATAAGPVAGDPVAVGNTALAAIEIIHLSSYKGL